MNFYHVYYKRQYWDKDNAQWKDTYYNHQGIVVIASNFDAAKIKIERCLLNVEKENYRAVLVSDIVECIGLDMRQGFDDSFNVCPICIK